VALVVPEIFGVHEHIQDVVRRLAKLGYLAIAVEPFARYGGTVQLKGFDEIRKVVGKVPDAEVMSDLDAAVTWAAAHGGSDRVAITGFCWGGRIVWLYAAHRPTLKAGVAWYGRLEAPPVDLRPKNPLDLVANIDPPVLGLYGGDDKGIPNDSVERMRSALKAAGKRSEIVLYPGTPHAFHADYRPSYREGPAKDGWKRMLAWFKQNGAGAAPRPGPR
jgi:carboxymethylenebutenolidase